MFTRLLLFILVCVAAISLVWCQDPPFVTVVAISAFVLQLAMAIIDAKRNESYKKMEEELKNTKWELERAEKYCEQGDKMLNEARAEVQNMREEAHPNPFKVGDAVRHGSSERKMVVSMLCDYPNVWCEWIDEGQKKQNCVFDFRTLKKTTKF